MMARFLSTKPYILAELAVLTLVLPLAIIHFHLIRYTLPIIWGAGLYCAWVHKRTTGEGLHRAWCAAMLNRAHLTPILRRFFAVALVIGACVALWQPQLLFSFLRMRPWFWLLVMIAYPLLSVLPQEMIFRVFFFDRYKGLFRSERAMMVASGLTFGFAHIIFENWLAPLLCVVGGVLFARTYARHRALSVVALEHALYGDFLFTIGLGMYFYHGSVALAAH